MQHGPRNEAVGTSPESLPGGELAAFMLQGFPALNLERQSGQMTPDEYDAEVAAAMETSGLTDTEMNVIAEDADRRGTTLYLLLFLQKGLEAAHDFSDEYFEQRESQPPQTWIRQLAEREEVPPRFSWTWTAIRYREDIPLTFLPGDAGAFERKLFLGQKHIEEAALSVLEGPYRELGRLLDPGTTASEPERRGPMLDQFAKMTRATRFMADQMVALRTAGRPEGEFYLLDRYLGPNKQEPIGYGSGAYSALTYLVGHVITGNPIFSDRLLDPRNRGYFDPRTDGFIADLERGEMPDLYTLLESSGFNGEEKRQCMPDLLVVLEDYLSLYASHYGNVARMAHKDLPRSSPVHNSEQPVTNRRSMTQITTDTQALIAKIRSDYDIPGYATSRAREVLKNRAVSE